MACDCKHPYQFMSAEGLEEYHHASEVEFGTVWKGFKENTTAHGIPHVYHARGPFKVILWILLSLVSMGLLAYSVVGLAVRFSEWPISVTVTVENVKQIDFPAVTLCNMNPIKASALLESTDLEDIFSTSSINQTSQGRKRRAVPAYTEETLVAIQLKKYLAEQALETKVAYGHQRDDLLLEIKYEGIQISTDAFYSWFDPTHGNCFTFNSGWANSSDIRTSHLTGPLYGLDVIFNIEQDEYIGPLSHSAGVRVIIHNRTTMPFPAEQGFTISPGEITYIGMVELEIDRLGGRYGNCTKVSSEQNFTRNVYEEYYPVLYTADACIHTCFQKNVIEHCGCAASEIPTEGQAFGNADVSVCDITDPTGYTCYNDVKERYIHSELSCECEKSCHEVEYLVTTSSGVWPSDNYKEDLLYSMSQSHPDLQELLYHPNDTDKYLRNLGKVSLYFSQFNREVITEKVAYTATTFISDIGGVLGLFIGFSVLTIAEFLELAADFIILACCKCCRKKTVKDGSLSKISANTIANKNLY